MKSISFSITRVNRLRRAAVRAREIPGEESYPRLGRCRSNDWFASAYDANDLISVFETLRLKPGFALHAYEFRQGPDGNGIIWAVPAGAPLVAPDECPRLEDTWLHPPRPPGAVPLMQAGRGRWESLVLPVRIDPPPRGGGIWSPLAWLHLDPSDDSIQAPTAGRWPGCTGCRGGSDQRRSGRRLDVARPRSEDLGAELCRAVVDEESRPAHPQSRRRRADLPGHRHLSGR